MTYNMSEVISMNAYEEYLTGLIAQKREEGLLPELSSEREALLVDMVTDVLHVFDGVSTETAASSLQSLRDLLRRLEETSGTEKR